MEKRTIFSRPVFSLRPLIPLVATLCLASGMLIGTFPAYAAAPLTFILNGLGQGKSANILFRGQQLGQCVTKKASRTGGDVTGAGMFSVDFYSTNDCSGTRGNYARTQTTVDATYSCDGSKSTDLCTKES